MSEQPNQDQGPLRQQDNLIAFRQKRVEENRRAQAPVVQELASLGLPVKSIPDLYNGRLDYRNAIPTLLRWLPVIDNPDVKEAIVRALSVKWAKPWAARPLLDEYPKAHDPTGTGLKWAIGNALAVVADDAVFEDLAEIARNRGNGRAREMVVRALGNIKDPRAVDILIELLEDDEVSGHAVVALGKLRPKRARSELERFLTHPQSWVRTEAKKALAKIDKSG